MQGVAHIRHSADGTGAALITVHCPASIELLAAAIETIAPVNIRMNYNSDAFGRHHPIVRYQFEPTEEGKTTLDGVKLDVQEEDGQVVGKLEINLREHTLADRLRALVRQDRVHYTVGFPIAALSAGETGSAGPEVLAQLEAWFKLYQPDAPVHP